MTDPPAERGGGSTRAMLAGAADAQASVEELAAIVRAARAEVVEAFEVARDPQLWTTLERRSIEAVKDIVDGRNPLEELSAHGIFSTADVLRAGTDRLTSVPGVGEGTARKAIHAAEQLRQVTRDSLQFRIDFDPKNAEMTQLLGALAVWGLVRHAGEAHEAHAERVANELAVQRPIAAPAGAGLLRRLFTRARDRARADEAARRIRQLLSAAETKGLLRAAADVRAVRTPGADEVWRDFERRSAACYGLLGEVVNLGGDAARGRGVPAGRDRRAGRRPAAGHLPPQGRLRLRGYQSFGIRFALVQRRVVLGDEMGLGKTIQSIATMAHLAARGATHFLVVCRASVLINWTKCGSSAPNRPGAAPLGLGLYRDPHNPMPNAGCGCSVLSR